MVREQVNDAIRRFFKTQGFHEVETPILVACPGAEPFLEVFETQLTTASGEVRRGFLITSPEYAMKKLLAGGMGNIFQITKAFRNEEGVGGTHNSEFTILEWYRTKADYTEVMSDFEKLFLEIMKATRPAFDGKRLTYLGDVFDVGQPWERISIREAFLSYANIDQETLLSEAGLLQAGAQKGYTVTRTTTWEEIYNQILFNEIEPKLTALKRPVFLYEYPLSQAALAKRAKHDPRFAERFEVFLGGIELGNAFSELTDPTEQAQRLTEDLALRKKLGKTEYGMDEDFIEALRLGMPECAGIAVGVDRLVMLASDVATIQETLFFPLDEVFSLE